MKWTEEKIAALSPNDSTTRRAKLLASSAKWELLATNYEAIWGICKGSGTQPYLVQSKLNGQNIKCNCPVRKQPCKHVLGLLFLFQKSSALFKYQAPPSWFSNQVPSVSIAESSPDNSEKSLSKTEEELEKAKLAKEKRWQQRLQLMASGMDELELWISDLIRQGIANTDAQKASFWNKAAAKMVDAKLPSISNYLKESYQIIATEQDWSELIVARLGELYLWIEAFKKRDKFSEAVQDDLFRSLGKTTKKADVIASNKNIKDNWYIIAKKEDRDIEGRDFRKVWLFGQKTQQEALILDYTFGNAGYEHQYIVGDIISGKLAFYSNNYPQRAVFAHLEEAKHFLKPTIKPQKNLSEFLKKYSTAIAKNPWLRVHPICLSNIKVSISEKQKLILIDTENSIIPLSPLEENNQWKLLALSGGQEITLFGEWNGYSFEPLTMIHVDRIESLT